MMKVYYYHQHPKLQKYKLPSTPLKSIKYTNNNNNNNNNSEIIKPNSNSLVAESESGLFQGMIFCITSIDGDRKLQLKSMIETNGGILWDKENEISVS